MLYRSAMPQEHAQRLEQIRQAILAENVSYGELAELQELASYIDPSDVLLREWAGLPEDLTDPTVGSGESTHA